MELRTLYPPAKPPTRALGADALVCATFHAQFTWRCITPRINMQSSSRLVRIVAALAFALFSLATGARAGEILYAIGNGPGLSAIYTIDVATGAATHVWDLPNMYVYAGGLAYDASTDDFYAIGSTVSNSDSRLFRISRASGAITPLPGIGPSLNFSTCGLAFHPLTGVLYASGSNGFQSSALFTIDKNTGVPTLIGQCGGQCCTAPFGFNVYGLGFRSDGALFANGITLSTTPVNGAYSELYSIDIASGLATQIGIHGVNVGRQLAYSDLAFGLDGTLYSMGSLSGSQNGLYRVDPATAVATPIGDLGVSMGADGGLVFVNDGTPTKYCTAKTNSQGCTPVLTFTGLPSASSAAPFTIGAVNVLNQKPGLLLYGYANHVVPFQGGYLCMPSPLRRLGAGSAGGNALPPLDCSGSYALDFNVRIQSGLDPLLVPGQEIDAQYWSRDPASPTPTGLTDAVSFVVGA